MKFERASGILLHPTSLPGNFGIGDLGPQAYRFVDWLCSSGTKLWQILPLGPTGYGDSPYQSFSAFAGNPYLISPEELIKSGLLGEDDLSGKPDFPPTEVDYGSVIPWKMEMLQLAHERFLRMGSQTQQAFNYFCAENAAWLQDYALFMAIKEKFGGGSWEDWPDELKHRHKADFASIKSELTASVLQYSFYQYIFYQQWQNLHNYSKEHGVKIIGDIPIFVAFDSADVWCNPELFRLDEHLHPLAVSGVPPDIFSSTGQLWGNPLYDWQKHEESGFAWWMARIRSSLMNLDMLRLDHFRGFAGAWEIPAASETAEHGQWVPGPGATFFEALDTNLGDGLITPWTGLPLIAEDLGVITPDVIDLRESFNLPGMKILQFGFNSADNPFLPHNYKTDCVAYTGTHDNDTSLGWLASAPMNERDFAYRYLKSNGSDFAWDLIRAIWSSVAVFAITPMQDVLRLSGEARMNYPSSLGGNWRWRMSGEDLNANLANELKEINNLYSR